MQLGAGSYRPSKPNGPSDIAPWYSDPQPSFSATACYRRGRPGGVTEAAVSSSMSGFSPGASAVIAGMVGTIGRRRKFNFGTRLVSNAVFAYIQNIGLGCRTLFLAQTAPSAIFLSQHRANRMPCTLHGKQFSMSD